MFASAKVWSPLPSQLPPRTKSNCCFLVIRRQEFLSIRHLRRSHGAPEPLQFRIQMRILSSLLVRQPTELLPMCSARRAVRTAPIGRLAFRGKSLVGGLVADIEELGLLVGS